MDSCKMFNNSVTYILVALKIALIITITFRIYYKICCLAAPCRRALSR